MSKAEDRALEKYPIEMYEEVGWRCVDKNIHKRQYFIEGYDQAEKDLELSWEDIEKVCIIAREVHQFRGFWSESVYQEILKRFKAQKGKKI